MNSEDKALKAILGGKPVTKRVMVGYEGKKQKSGDQKSRLTDIMAEARMPMFCPKCDKIMKNAKLDGKMWRLYGHCFDCQIQVEHKMRIDGTFELWEKSRYLRNKESIIKEQIGSIEEWKNQGDMSVVEPINVDSGAVHIEKYQRDSKLLEIAEEALVDLGGNLKQIRERIKEVDAELEANKRPD